MCYPCTSGECVTHVRVVIECVIILAYPCTSGECVIIPAYPCTSGECVTHVRVVNGPYRSSSMCADISKVNKNLPN